MDRVVARYTGLDYIEASKRHDHTALAEIKAEFDRLNALAAAAGGWKRFNEANGGDPYKLARTNKPVLNEEHMLWVCLTEDGDIIYADARATTEAPGFASGEWVIAKNSDPDNNYPNFEEEMREFLCKPR